ncbi:HNH endonuclease [Martelella alba]|uniref:Putative HNH nuclease YajD n=1 Tax=Martelella alba TaxID=2590451 RepID=A0A506U444_9HYPH|nr:HNH endonuclease signature motif containing protein [Martelella alba]TPW28600.1 HNH endonuclease [Martelella alba]
MPFTKSPHTRRTRSGLAGSPRLLGGTAPALLNPSILTGEGGERRRDQVVAWRSWYKTTRWQKLRWSVLKRDGFTCAMCGKVEADTSQLVADHMTPHRGDAVLFWDRDNLQCLCKTCHDSEKQRAERA